MFEWQEQYLTRSLRSPVRLLFLPREHKIHIFELTCNVLFIILTYWWRFWWFSEDFRRFSKIVPKARQTFPNIFREFSKISEDVRRCPKIAEDFRGGPEDVSMMHQRIWVQFNRQTWYQWNHRYLHMREYHIVFINLLPLGIPLTFIQ